MMSFRISDLEFQLYNAVCFLEKIMTDCSYRKVCFEFQIYKDDRFILWRSNMAMNDLPQSPPDVGELFDEQKKGFYTLQASMLYKFSSYLLSTKPPTRMSNIRNNHQKAHN